MYDRHSHTTFNLTFCLLHKWCWQNSGIFYRTRIYACCSHTWYQLLEIMCCLAICVTHLYCSFEICSHHFLGYTLNHGHFPWCLYKWKSCSCTHYRGVCNRALHKNEIWTTQNCSFSPFMLMSWNVALSYVCFYQWCSFFFFFCIPTKCMGGGGEGQCMQFPYRVDEKETFLCRAETSSQTPSTFHVGLITTD